MSNIIDSLCMTWRHDYGLYKADDDDSISSGMTTAEREALRQQMSQIYAHHIAPLEDRIRALESASQPGSVDSPEYERGYADGKRDTRFVMLSEGFRKPETGSQPGSGEAVTESMMIAGARSLIDGQENRPGSSWADEAKWCFEAMTLAAPSAGNGEAKGGRE